MLKFALQLVTLFASDASEATGNSSLAWMDWSQLRRRRNHSGLLPQTHLQSPVCGVIIDLDTEPLATDKDDIMYNTRIRNLKHIRSLHYGAIVSRLRTLRQAIRSCAADSNSFCLSNKYPISNDIDVHGHSVADAGNDRDDDDEDDTFLLRDGNFNPARRWGGCASRMPASTEDATTDDTAASNNYGPGHLNNSAHNTNPFNLTQLATPSHSIAQNHTNHFPEAPSPLLTSCVRSCLHNITALPTLESTSSLPSYTDSKISDPSIIPPLLSLLYFQHEYEYLFSSDGRLVEHAGIVNSAQTSLGNANKHYNLIIAECNDVQGVRHVSCTNLSTQCQRDDEGLPVRQENPILDLLKKTGTTALTTNHLENICVPAAVLQKRIYFATENPDERRNPVASWTPDVSRMKKMGQCHHNLTSWRNDNDNITSRRSDNEWVYTVPLHNASSVPKYVVRKHGKHGKRESLRFPSYFQRRTNYPFRKTHLSLSMSTNCNINAPPAIALNAAMLSLIKATHLNERLEIDFLPDALLRRLLVLLTAPRGRFFDSSKGIK